METRLVFSIYYVSHLFGLSTLHHSQDKYNHINYDMSHKTESDLFKEVCDGQCCWTESGKVTHLIPNTHPLKALLLPLIPSSMTFSLWREENSYHILARHVHDCYF